MYLKKGICSLVFASAVLTLPVALNHRSQENSDKVRVDGGAPPPPPIKWKTGAQAGPQLNADGGAPPPPPIKWYKRAQTGPQLIADGGAPPPPPIKWFKRSGASSLRADA